jgi:predicted DsbA family dithiol-disulfide isomerase
VELGLDTATFNSCLDSGKKAAVVDDDMDAGEEAGVFTTPTMIINGRVLEGNHPYAMIERVIKFELNRR